MDVNDHEDKLNSQTTYCSSHVVLRSSKLPYEMLLFCQFISNKTQVIVLSQISKDPGRDNHYNNNGKVRLR